MKLSGKLDQKFLLLFLFVMIASPNYFIFGFGENQVADDLRMGNISFDSLQFSSDNAIFAGADKVISINGRNSIALSGPVGSLAAGNPLIALETATSDSKFSFVYNESNSVATDIGMANDDTFTVDPIDATAYDRLEVDVDVYTEKLDYVVQDSIDGTFQTLFDYSTFAQGTVLAPLDSTYNSTSAFIRGFNFTLLVGISGMNVTGEVWNATKDGTKLVPHKPLQSNMLFTTADGVMPFNFTNPVAINHTNTYVNTTGGYVFFILTRYYEDAQNGLVETGTTSENGATYIYVGADHASPPTSVSDWPTQSAFDFTSAYNVSYEFEPLSILTTVDSTSVGTNGLWHENAHIETSTAYQVHYDGTLVYGLTALINVSYTNIMSVISLADVSYTVSPKLAELNWTIDYVSPYAANSATIRKYFLLPNGFTDIVVYSDTIELTPSTHYELIAGTDNQSLFMKVGAGTFKITANSTNQFTTATTTNYVFDTSWQPNNIGQIGVLYPSIEEGDLVRNTITNIGSLDVSAGSVNSSLRTENGIILGEYLGYTDNYLSTDNYNFIGSVSFDTNLDPDIPVGVYSFQHIWFNGTAGGAIYSEFQVIPVTHMGMYTPASINILEGSMVNFEFTVIDYSHNDRWSGADKNVEWDLEANISTLAYVDKIANDTYRYAGIIDVDIDINPVQVQTYVVNITFSEGPYTDFLLFSFNVYYRGGNGISGSDTLEAGDDLLLKFQILNETVDGTGFDSIDVTLEADTPYTSVYNAVDKNHTLTILWDNAFTYGSNQISLNWSHPDFRSIADQNYTLFDYQFTVTDGVGPVFDSTPGATDQFMEGSTGNTITWDASDRYPDTYSIESNYTGSVSVVDSGSWTSIGTETVDLDPHNLQRGVYNYTIVYQDEASIEIKHTIIITVIDNIDPAIDEPADITNYIEGTAGHTITWTVSDIHASVYNITENGVNVALNVDWSALGTVIYNNNGLERGTYTYNITIFDDSDNSVWDIVIVTVLDTTDPLIDNPADITDYIEGTAGHSITWTVSDIHASVYNITENGVNVALNVDWSSLGTIIYNNNGLVRGTYTYNITIFDDSDNSVWDIVIVTVLDTTDPIIDEPPDITDYIEETTGHSITWSLNDIHAWVYNITENGILVVKNGDWNSGTINYIIDGLARGTYTYNITIFDDSNNSIWNIVIVTVSDTTDPIIDEPADITDYIEETTGHSITWTVNDIHAWVYNITENGVLVVKNGIWTSGSIEYVINDLTRGTYTYNITIFDDSDNSAWNIVVVTVLDTTNPVIDEPADITDYLEGTKGNFINWTVSDIHTLVYNITRNGTYIGTINTVWASGSIYLNIDGLLQGHYVFIITIYDDSYNSISDLVAVTVLDKLDPILVSNPNIEIQLFDNQTSYTFIWSAKDNNSYQYLIFLNGTEIQSSSWESSENIIYELDELLIGVYNYTIIFYDTSDNNVTHTVILIIKDSNITESKSPIFSIIENIYEGTIETIDVNWYTLSDRLIDNAIVNLTIVSVNSSIFPDVISYIILADSTGDIQLLFNYTSLVPGDYYWIITFQKNGFESIKLMKDFTIHPHVVSIELQIDEVLTQGEEFKISAKLTYNNPIGLVLNGITSSRQGTISDLEIIFTIIFTTQTGENSSLSSQIFTDENGIALWVLNPDLTATMQTVNSINTGIISSASYMLPQIVSVPTADLPEVKESQLGISDILNDIREIIEEYLELFIAIVFVLLTTIVVIVFQVKRKRERTRLFDHLKLRTAEEMEGLLSINAIIIKSTYSGVPFYERVFEDAINIDLALLSGVTTAITSVLSEIQKNKEGFEIMQRSGLSITTHHGELTTYVIVSNEELPDIIRSQIEDAHSAFDEQYKHMADEPLLLNTIGRTPINQHISNYVKISLKENLRINDGVINKIQDKKSITRKIRSNLKTLMDLNVSIREAELPLTLYSLFEFLRAQGMDNEQIYQTISTANAHGIIESTEA